MPFSFPKSALPDEPTFWQQVERNIAAKAEFDRLKALYRKHIIAERDAERRTLEARNAQEQAERRQNESNELEQPIGEDL